MMILPINLKKKQINIDRDARLEFFHSNEGQKLSEVLNFDLESSVICHLSSVMTSGGE